jgi:hypothetical protein
MAGMKKVKMRHLRVNLRKVLRFGVNLIFGPPSEQQTFREHFGRLNSGKLRVMSSSSKDWISGSEVVVLASESRIICFSVVGEQISSKPDGLWVTFEFISLVSIFCLF